MTGADDSGGADREPDGLDHPWERDDPPWPVHDSEVVWETPFFEAGYDVVERPDGERADYYWLEPADAAVVVALTDEDEVLVVEQYRPRHRTTVRSLPAGAVEDGEAPAAGARRELREETGYRPETLTHLESYAPSMYERLVRHVYVARDLTPGEQDLDDAEFLTVEAVPADHVLEYVRGHEGPPFGGAITPLLLAREAGHL